MLDDFYYYFAITGISNPFLSIFSQWFPGSQGLFGSIVVASFGFGSVIWNPLETAFVNPDNVSPTEEDGEDV